MQYHGATFFLFIFRVGYYYYSKDYSQYLLHFRIPNVVVTSIFLWTIATSLDFNMLLLAVHMKELGNYSPVLVGIMFGLMAGGYTLCNPFLGFCTKTKVSYDESTFQVKFKLRNTVLICSKPLLSTQPLERQRSAAFLMYFRVFPSLAS